jgi:hypothetical protein
MQVNFCGAGSSKPNPNPARVLTDFRSTESPAFSLKNGEMSDTFVRTLKAAVLQLQAEQHRDQRNQLKVATDRQGLKQFDQRKASKSDLLNALLAQIDGNPAEGASLEGRDLPALEENEEIKHA